MSDVLVNDDAFEALVTPAVRPLLRYAATAMAVTRVAIGVTALAWPALPARAWVGPSDQLGSEVLGRALGARDLALGLGALAALSKGPSGARAASAWCAAGALSDALDCATTAAAWPRLPRVTRWLVAGSSGGAAIVGAAGAAALPGARRSPRRAPDLVEVALKRAQARAGGNRLRRRLGASACSPAAAAGTS